MFGDGSDSRLYPLTKRRSEGAIPIAANYRLIDAVVSNCINSNINKIYALTQFNSTSLNSHLTRAYSGVGLRKEGFVEVIAAYQSPEYNGWFQVTKFEFLNLVLPIKIKLHLTNSPLILFKFFVFFLPILLGNC